MAGVDQKLHNDRTIAELKAKIVYIPKTIDRRSCFCASEGAGCHHPPQIQDNQKWYELAGQIRKLQATAFCLSCGCIRENPHWLRCPYCHHAEVEIPWTGIEHTSACLATDPTALYCAGCGKPNQ
jgi:hypothetical protein